MSYLWSFEQGPEFCSASLVVVLPSADNQGSGLLLYPGTKQTSVLVLGRTPVSLIDILTCPRLCFMSTTLC